MAQSTGKRRLLTARERLFLQKLFENGLESGKAYLAMSAELGKEVAPSTAESQGPRMRRRICQTVEFSEILASRGIDSASLSNDIDRLRTMQRPAFDREGKLVGQFDDGMVQLGAAKLIAESLDVVKKPDNKVVIENLSIGYPPKPDDLDAPAAAALPELPQPEEGAGA